MVSRYRDIIETNQSNAASSSSNQSSSSVENTPSLSIKSVNNGANKSEHANQRRNQSQSDTASINTNGKKKHLFLFKKYQNIFSLSTYEIGHKIIYRLPPI
jgi:hypothetical protein